MEKNNTQPDGGNKELKNDVTAKAQEIYGETFKWLKQRRCDEIVSKERISQYAGLVARWQDCEQNISKFGYLAKDPKTGSPITSPYVEMSLRYMKLANAVWAEVTQTVYKQTGICL